MVQLIQEQSTFTLAQSHLPPLEYTETFTPLWSGCLAVVAVVLFRIDFLLTGNVIFFSVVRDTPLCLLLAAVVDSLQSFDRFSCSFYLSNSCWGWLLVLVVS